MACVPPEELVGYGTLLQYKNPLTNAFVTVAGTKDLSFPRQVRGAVETTDSGSGGWRRRIPSPLKDMEPVELEMKFLASQWLVLRAMFDDGTITDWRLVLMDQRQFYLSFCAFISAMGGEAPMEELVLAPIELTPTGGPSAGYLN